MYVLILTKMGYILGDFFHKLVTLYQTHDTSRDSGPTCLPTAQHSGRYGPAAWGPRSEQVVDVRGTDFVSLPGILVHYILGNV
jgi:hypothetical protein